MLVSQEPGISRRRVPFMSTRAQRLLIKNSLTYHGYSFIGTATRQEIDTNPRLSALRALSRTAQRRVRQMTPEPVQLKSVELRRGEPADMPPMSFRLRYQPGEAGRVVPTRKEVPEYSLIIPLEGDVTIGSTPEADEQVVRRGEVAWVAGREAIRGEGTHIYFPPESTALIMQYVPESPGRSGSN